MSEQEPERRKRLTGLRKAVKEKCRDCMADYADGRCNCEVPACPLYPWMPYKRERKIKETKANEPEHTKD